MKEKAKEFFSTFFLNLNIIKFFRENERLLML